MKNLCPPTMSDHPWIPLTESKPTEKHANNDQEVSYYYIGEYGKGNRSGHWQRIPDDATHWRMETNSPETSNALTEKQIKEDGFKRGFLDRFKNPIIERSLAENECRFFYDLGYSVARQSL